MRCFRTQRFEACFCTTEANGRRSLDEIPVLEGQGWGETGWDLRAKEVTSKILDGKSIAIATVYHWDVGDAEVGGIGPGIYDLLCVLDKSLGGAYECNIGIFQVLDETTTNLQTRVQEQLCLQKSNTLMPLVDAVIDLDSVPASPFTTIVEVEGKGTLTLLHFSKQRFNDGSQGMAERSWKELISTLSLLARNEEESIQYTTRWGPVFERVFDGKTQFRLYVVVPAQDKDEADLIQVAKLVRSINYLDAGKGHQERDRNDIEELIETLRQENAKLSKRVLEASEAHKRARKDITNKLVESQQAAAELSARNRDLLSKNESLEDEIGTMRITPGDSEDFLALQSQGLTKMLERQLLCMKWKNNMMSRERDLLTMKANAKETKIADLERMVECHEGQVKELKMSLKEQVLVSNALRHDLAIKTQDVEIYRGLLEKRDTEVERLVRRCEELNKKWSASDERTTESEKSLAKAKRKIEELTGSVRSSESQPHSQQLVTMIDTVSSKVESLSEKIGSRSRDVSKDGGYETRLDQVQRNLAELTKQQVELVAMLNRVQEREEKHSIPAISGDFEPLNTSSRPVGRLRRPTQAPSPPAIEIDDGSGASSSEAPRPSKKRQPTQRLRKVDRLSKIPLTHELKRRRTAGKER